MGVIASQITSLAIVYLTVYSKADQIKHQSSASLAFVRGIHWGPVNYPHKWPVTRKMFPFDDVIMFGWDLVQPQVENGPWIMADFTPVEPLIKGTSILKTSMFLVSSCHCLCLIQSSRVLTWEEDFLHERPWILPWIKSMSNLFDIIIHMITSQLSGNCDVIWNRLWSHQQKENQASETRGRCVKIVILSSFMDSLCHARNKILYVLSWWTVSALTWLLFLCLFPSLLCNLGNKYQNNPLVSAETLRHESTCIILYVVGAVPTGDHTQ